MTKRHVFGILANLVIIFAIVLGAMFGARDAKAANAPDPQPRFVMLGEEHIGNSDIRGAVRAYVYVDRATRDEIICFGEYSCWKSGRQR